MKRLKTIPQIPDSFKLLHTIQKHEKNINDISWSPDGKTIASTSDDSTICLWDSLSGKLVKTLKGHDRSVLSVCWAPNSLLIASGSADQTIRIWDSQSGRLTWKYPDKNGAVNSIEWSPDGRFLAWGSSDDGSIRICDVLSISDKLHQTLICHKAEVKSVAWSLDMKFIASSSVDKTICIWDAHKGELHHILEGHHDSVFSIAWDTNSQTLASGSVDKTIRIWNPENGQLLAILEGHTSSILCVRFSPYAHDNFPHILASESDDTIHFWRCDTWESVAVLDKSIGKSSTINMEDLLEKKYSYAFYGKNFLDSQGGLAFHPTAPTLATRGGGNRIIHVWQLDHRILFATTALSEPKHYRNAKVVLVGDTGVGKSGLGLVLTGQTWEATESTHGRHVWTFDSQDISLSDGRQETREILLWDLAGQPGYRLIHQLHLNEVAIALVVFDARSETEPFAGVRHWNRALTQAQHLQRIETISLKKYLVAARADRGGISVSRERINYTVNKMDFNGFFETSAKEGWQVFELIKAIREGIDWDGLPSVSSNEMFQIIKQFLVDEKKVGRLLSTFDDLYRLFCQTHSNFADNNELRAKFNTCIGRVECRGLIRQLSFGNYILLQPELLDAYASAMINAAKSEPDGLGFIPEEDALNGRFKMPTDERVANKNQEKLLLIATIEELLQHELALKEVTDLGTDLVFPSQFTRELPNAPELPGKFLVFTFKGAILNIYATLTVRLSRSQFFNKESMWRNSATYIATVGGSCGIYLREIGEGHGELTLFFDEAASETTRYQFEDYVFIHLKRRTLPNTIGRRRIIFCPECNESITNSQAKRRRERGFRSIRCNVCDTEISLLDREERLEISTESAIKKMDRAADAQRSFETASTILKGKIESGDYDVFLCHKSPEKSVIKEIGQKLKEQGILPWLDEWEVPPGTLWQEALGQQIESIKSVAVFIGPGKPGPWQGLELEAFIKQFIERRCPVIPVILPTVKGEPEIPPFLSLFNYIDLRKKDPDPLKMLIWGITGKRKELEDNTGNN
jgi:WD40 repeat protein